MGEDSKYKSFDSRFMGQFTAARLAMDPQVNEGDHGPMVRLKVVATSKNQERFSDLWVEINVSKWNAVLASYLEKGDIIAEVRGRIAYRTWGDDNEKSTVSLEQAEIVIMPDMYAVLKERGWEPGSEEAKGSDTKKKSKKDDKKKGGKGKTEQKPTKPQKKVIEIPDDDDEPADDEEEDNEDE